MFRTRFKNRSKIVEIGFGNGELLSYVSKLGHQVVGVEINKDLVERAKKSNYMAYSGVIWKIPELQSEKFDLIVGTAVAEHIHYNDLVEFFSWANTHLNDNRHFIWYFLKRLRLLVWVIRMVILRIYYA